MVGNLEEWVDDRSFRGLALDVFEAVDTIQVDMTATAAMTSIGFRGGEDSMAVASSIVGGEMDCMKATTRWRGGLLVGEILIDWIGV
jgi:hypothetical protein